MAYFPTVKMSKIQRLKALVSERLSVAAEEIFRIVERTLVEHEEEVSRSKWAVDHHYRLLDAAQLHRTDSLQVTDTELRVPSGHHQPSAKWNPSLDQKEPENAGSESTDGRGTLIAANPDSPPAQSENSESDQEILTDIEDGDTRRTCDSRSLFKILKVKKPYKCPICMNSFSSKKTARRHVKIHSEDKSLSHQCQFCDRYFCHKPDLIDHIRIHTGEKPYRCQECHKCFAQKGNLVVHVRKHAGENPYQCREYGQCFTKKVALDHHTEKHLGLVTLPGNGEQERGTSQRVKLSPGLESAGIKTPALSLPHYDQSEFDQESLQPLCLYQIQTVDDIDKDSSTILKIDEIKTEPAGEDHGSSESAANCQPPVAGNRTPSASAGEQDHQLARTISEDVPPEQYCEQKWSPSWGQENPQTPHTKDEGQELKTDEDDEQFRGLGSDRTIPFVTPQFDQAPHQPPRLYRPPTEENGERDFSTSCLVNRFKTEPIGVDCGRAETTAVSQPVYAANPGYFAIQNEQGEKEEEEAEGLSTSVLSELNRLAGMGLLLERRPGKACEPSVQFEVQTAQKRYKCPHCGKCFSLTKTLMRHVKIHTGDKLYQCQFCRRNFCQKSDLVTHIRIHTGERPYQCQECHKSFSHKSNLTVHMRTHTREKPCLYKQ